MNVGDKVKILKCAYKNTELCEGNTGRITFIGPYISVRLDNNAAGIWPYDRSEIEVLK